MIHSERCQAKTMFEGEKCGCRDAIRHKVEFTIKVEVNCANCEERAPVELTLAPSADTAFSSSLLVVGSTTPTGWARGQGRIDRHAGWRRFFCQVCKVEATR